MPPQNFSIYYCRQLRIVGGWSPTWVHSAPRPFTVLLCLPRVIVRIENYSVEWRLAGKPKYSEKTCPSATLSTTHPTWPDPGSNPGRRGGKPATNLLSYGTAYCRQLVTGFPSRRHGFQSQAGSCGICGGQSGDAASFLRVLRFPLPILVAPTAPHLLITQRYSKKGKKSCMPLLKLQHIWMSNARNSEDIGIYSINSTAHILVFGSMTSHRLVESYPSVRGTCFLRLHIEEVPLFWRLRYNIPRNLGCHLSNYDIIIQNIMIWILSVV
jgi:hypothetical protein